MSAPSHSTPDLGLSHKSLDETSAQPEAPFPVSGSARDGYSNADEATATCYCGAVQLAFPVDAPGLVGTFICHCTDCRKITASMFASNFIVADSHLKHLRGKDTLHQFAQSTTITSGNLMTNHFCSKCGTLMYRVGSGLPGHSIMRLGTVDDFSLHASKLKPKVEQFVECRVEWLQEAKGIEQCKGSSF